MIIWDLCGGSQNSVYHALKWFREAKIYTFDVAKPQHDNQYVLDLTRQDIIEQLHKYPKPDIIFASPLCQSFSWILNCNGNERVAWTKNNEGKWVIRDLEGIAYHCQKTGFLRQNVPERMKERAELGYRLLSQCIKIIQHFKPKFWYIENPEKSLMWEIIQQNFSIGGYHNLAHYNSYDLSFTIKPTIFLSNLQMDLHAYGIKGNVVKPKAQRVLGNPNTKEQGGRVRIPYLLLIHIYQLMKKEIK